VPQTNAGMSHRN